MLTNSIFFTMEGTQVHVVSGEAEEEELTPKEQLYNFFLNYRTREISKIKLLASALVEQQRASIDSDVLKIYSEFDRIPDYLRRLQLLKKKMQRLDVRRTEVLERLSRAMQYKDKKASNS